MFFNEICPEKKEFALREANVVFFFNILLITGDIREHLSRTYINIWYLLDLIKYDFQSSLVFFQETSTL